MKRVNGYIDLKKIVYAECKKRGITKRAVDRSDIVTKSCVGSCPAFWISTSEEKFLYKEFKYEYCCFSELIAEELAKYLGLKVARYDLAKYGHKKGVISYDFTKADYEYVSLTKILAFYYNGCLANEEELRYLSPSTFKNNISTYELLNNLEDIWNALEFYIVKKHLIKKDRIKKVIGDLMLEITDYFSYQLISGHYDMNKGNITVAIAKNRSNAELTPLYDNEDMFKRAGEIIYDYRRCPLMPLERQDFTLDNSAYEILRKYLMVSDNYFVNRFILLINKLDRNTIYKIVESVESKINRTIPSRIVYRLAYDFNVNLENLRAVVLEVCSSNESTLKLRREIN